MSLAAATPPDLGFARATDLDGGFNGWAAAGFPVEEVFEEVQSKLTVQARACGGIDAAATGTRESPMCCDGDFE